MTALICGPIACPNMARRTVAAGEQFSAMVGPQRLRRVEPHWHTCGLTA